jgi:glycosyltransferase involved in cell wall biosynthesis
VSTVGDDDRASVPSLTVVMPFRDAESTVAAQLRALDDQDYSGSWEVVLVDNRSVDGSRAIVDGWAASREHVRVVEAGDADGVAHARNVGMLSARGEVLAYCDADDVVAPGWLTALVDRLGDCELAGGLVETGALNPPTVVAWVRANKRDGLQVAQRFLPYAPGSNFAVRREVALAVNGWDESYPYGGNDVEFSWRVQLAGNRIGWAPDAIVLYRLRATLRGRARQAFWGGYSDVQVVRDFRARGARRRPIGRRR